MSPVKKPTRHRRREPLSRGRVLATASELVEREGVAGLSMRKLAAKLGVEAMSLYNHVDGKDDVLAGVGANFLAQIDVPDPSDDWRSDLRDLSAALRDAARRRPQAAALAMSNEAISQEGLAVASAALDALRRAGLSAQQAVDAQRAMTALLVGTLLRELQVGPDATSSASDRESELSASELAPVRDAAPQLAQLDFDREYDFAVEFALDALEAQRREKPKITDSL